MSSCTVERGLDFLRRVRLRRVPSAQVNQESQVQVSCIENSQFNKDILYLSCCRWRKLEGSDPATFELLQKVQLLHRRLIRGSELLVERDLQIQEKEQLCQQLQTLLNRAPGAEVSRKLVLTQAKIKPNC